tara:strand:+ start:1060 stop:1431 length:372 start_codon:yes stop_codon:yes gene_type:complete
MTREPETRPSIKTISQEKQPLSLELFQNETLRPILKMKNDVIVNFFKQYLLDKKIIWADKKNDKKEEFIYENLTRDSLFKNAMIHLIVGNFSLKEFLEYIPTHKEYNKRIWKMIQQRLCSQLF